MLVCMIVFPIACVIFLTWPPVDPKLLMAFSVTDPMKSHLHCMISFWLDFLIDNSLCHCVIYLDRCWWLLVAHFLKNDTYVLWLLMT